MKKYERFRREILNLPNMITIGRIFLIPPVLMLIDKTDPVRCVLSALLFMFASVLDLIDGWLARRAGLITVFGKFVDPLADKIMVSAVLIYLVMDERLPAWLVVVLLTREFYINGLRTLASSDGVVIAASSGGKVKTAIQMTGLSFLLMHYRYRLPGMTELLDFHKIGLVLLLISVVISIYSAIEYTFAFREALAEKNAE